MRHLYSVLLIFAALLVHRVAFADAPLSYATLQPTQIRLGESAILTITNLGNGPAVVNVPQVKGLRFEVLGQRQQVEMTGGVALSSMATVVRVTPTAAGVFSIPPPRQQDRLLVLEVLPDHGSAPAYSNPFDASAPAQKKRPPVPAPGTARESGIRMAADGAAFVRLQLPKRSVYVGESVPVDIEVGARSGFVTSLNGLPTLNGGEFTFEDLSKEPERRETLIDGKPFVVLTWHSKIAAVKPGDFSLSVDTPLTVKFTTAPRSESAMDSLLGDPFLQQLFGATVSRELKITSPVSDLTVLALPSGAPPEFSGAVGTFAVTSELSAPQGTVGDPLTLRLRIEGRGNFDRVDSQMLGTTSGWKSYPPTSTFKPDDKIGYKGEKVFEQPVVALQPGQQQLPALTFSYFDPVAQRYQTARAKPLDLLVESAAGTQSASRTAVPHPSGEISLRPDHAPDVGTGPLVPLYLRPPFLALPPLLGLAFVGGWLARRPRGKPKAAARVVTPQVRALNARLSAARADGDPGQFLRAAQQALQAHFAAAWSLPVGTINAPEIRRRLGDNDISTLFALADEMRYAPPRSGDFDYERWQLVARNALEAKT